MKFVILPFAIGLVITLLEVVACWKVFSKARQPGWGCLIPIYNVYLWMKIAGKPGWWTILMFIPIVNIVFLFIAGIAIARAFGHGTGFGVCLVLFKPIMMPVLGYGESRYNPPFAAA